jgi:hypothetical protein
MYCHLHKKIARNKQCNLRKVKAEIGFKEGFGGPDRDRTDDLLHAMQALSQLSYGPSPRARGPYEVPVYNQKARAVSITISCASVSAFGC